MRNGLPNIREYLTLSGMVALVMNELYVTGTLSSLITDLTTATNYTESKPMSDTTDS